MPAQTALESVWRGTPITVVASPPGAGKTEAVTSIASTLAVRGNLSVVVACPTVSGAYDVAKRCAPKCEKVGRSRASLGKVLLGGSAFNRAVPGVTLSKKAGCHEPGKVVCRTLASCHMSPPSCDVLIIDEAYQATFAQARHAGAHAAQLLLVGDPGQIGPVVTLDRSPWAGGKLDPSSRAPEGFLDYPNVTRINMETTYRLGEPTVRVIAPLYDFTFTSSRPETFVEGYSELGLIDIPQPASPTDSRLIQATVERAQALSQVANTVAVIASRNEQVALLSAHVSSRNITVGTADSLQGRQFDAVVAIDPFAGAYTLSDHSAELGRLCVMLSRHKAHLTFVTTQDLDLSSLGREAMTHTWVRNQLRKEAS